MKVCFHQLFFSYYTNQQKWKGTASQKCSNDWNTQYTKWFISSSCTIKSLWDPWILKVHCVNCKLEDSKVISVLSRLHKFQPPLSERQRSWKVLLIHPWGLWWRWEKATEAHPGMNVLAKWNRDCISRAISLSYSRRQWDGERSPKLKLRDLGSSPCYATKHLCNPGHLLAFSASVLSSVEWLG